MDINSSVSGDLLNSEIKAPDSPHKVKNEKESKEELIAHFVKYKVKTGIYYNGHSYFIPRWAYAVWILVTIVVFAQLYRLLKTFGEAHSISTFPTALEDINEYSLNSVESQTPFNFTLSFYVKDTT